MPLKTYKNHPPVPKALQEALKDYPELIAGLQEVLVTTGVEIFMSKSQRYDQFEMAVASLKNRLEVQWRNASKEVKSAEATGNAELVAKAKEKEILIDDCYTRKLRQSLEELGSFFD